MYEQGRTTVNINLVNCTLNNVQFFGEDNSMRTIINFEQWGFKASYDLSKKGEIDRLRRDYENVIPKNRQEAKERGFLQNEQGERN